MAFEFEKWHKKKKGEYENRVGHAVDDYTMVFHSVLTFKDVWVNSKKYWLRWVLRQKLGYEGGTGNCIDPDKIRAEIKKEEAK